VIVSDNDAQVRDKNGALVCNDGGSPKLPGQDHAADIERHLTGVAARVRKIIFPVKDLTEWVEGGHTREEPDAIIERAPATAREAKGGNGAAAASVPLRVARLGLEGIVSKRKDSRYRSGRSPDWINSKNPNAPAVKREAEEDWGR
jgi:hypothetical protein